MPERTTPAARRPGAARARPARTCACRRTRSRPRGRSLRELPARRTDVGSMNTRDRHAVVAIHDVRDPAFAVQARPRADQLEAGALRIRRQLQRPAEAATPSMLSTVVGASCVPSTPFMREALQVIGGQLGGHARAPSDRSADTGTRRRRRARAWRRARAARGARARRGQRSGARGSVVRASAARRARRAPSRSVGATHARRSSARLRAESARGRSRSALDARATRARRRACARRRARGRPAAARRRRTA